MQLREKAYAVEVVEMKEFKNLATNGNDILAKISGINIRESGGVGSDFTLSLNGLSGNQVRTFLDGIPMDYFGTSLTLNNFSANLLERVELYKGVVPVHLSSDALGGAVNIVTNQTATSYLDVSYALGSFNTHIASLNTQYRNEKSGFTTKLMSFYNFSKNNYKVPVYLSTFENGVITPDDFLTEVEHFHDDYESKMVWLQTGFTKTRFADLLMVGVMYSDNYDEVQKPPAGIAEPAFPYGAVTEEESKWITNFSFRKNGLLNDKLNLDAYFVGVFSERESKDISNYKYDWYGNQSIYEPNYGEIDDVKSNLRLNVDNYIGRFNAEYVLNDNNNFAGHFNLNHYTNQGEDEFREDNQTVFNNPNTVVKKVGALSYTNASFNNKFKNTVFGKYYDYKISSVDTDFWDEEVPFESRQDYFGYGFTSTLVLDKFQIKASYENAIRFPEDYELFGNGLTVIPNPKLLPENSDNFNLGFVYSPTIFGNPFSFSANGFIRNAGDFINPVSFGIYTEYINYVNVVSKGVDFSASYIIDNKWFFVLNGSYFDKRDQDLTINGEHPRVPNEPYLFGNLSVTYRKPNLFKQNDNFAATVSQNFTNEFPLFWEAIGNSELGKAVVPEQLTTDLDFVYSLQNERYNFSFGIVNVWDTNVYDNYQQLKPGRTFNFKLRYFID